MFFIKLQSEHKKGNLKVKSYDPKENSMISMSLHRHLIPKESAWVRGWVSVKKTHENEEEEVAEEEEEDEIPATHENQLIGLWSSHLWCAFFSLVFPSLPHFIVATIARLAYFGSVV